MDRRGFLKRLGMVAPVTLLGKPPAEEQARAEVFRPHEIVTAAKLNRAFDEVMPKVLRKMRDGV